MAKFLQQYTIDITDDNCFKEKKSICTKEGKTSFNCGEWGLFLSRGAIWVWSWSIRPWEYKVHEDRGIYRLSWGGLLFTIYI